VLAHSAGMVDGHGGNGNAVANRTTVIAGADMVQGFLFAKLLSAKVAASLVEAAPQSRSRYVVQVSGIVRLEKLLSATTWAEHGSGCFAPWREGTTGMTPISHGCSVSALIRRPIGGGGVVRPQESMVSAASDLHTMQSGSPGQL
jgi:hypothetical protein